jgi:hypothetical protein
VAPPQHDTDYYTSSNELDVTTSAVTVAAIGVVGLVILLLVAAGLWREARVRARAAKAAEKGAESRKLAPGVAVIHGQVETEGGPAMRVVIQQQGEQHTVKGGIRHKWTEVDRTVEARPFSLILDSGERVEVQPGEGALLVDLLGIEPTQYPDRRTRTSELRPGDFIYAAGRLMAPIQGDAYRSTEQGFTLRPERGQRMLLSVEPLEARFLKKAFFHGMWALGFIAALLFTDGLLFHSYWQKLFWGRVVAADVTEPMTWTTRGKHGLVYHYGVTANVSVDGNQLMLNPETTSAFYNEARSILACHQPLTAPVVIVLPEGKPYNIGSRPALDGGAFMVAWMFFFGLAFGYTIHTRHARPWYERKKVVDTGSGPLGSPDALA